MSCSPFKPATKTPHFAISPNFNLTEYQQQIHLEGSESMLSELSNAVFAPEDLNQVVHDGSALGQSDLDAFPNELNHDHQEQQRQQKYNINTSKDASNPFHRVDQMPPFLGYLQQQQQQQQGASQHVITEDSHHFHHSFPTHMSYTDLMLDSNPAVAAAAEATSFDLENACRNSTYYNYQNESVNAWESNPHMDFADLQVMGFSETTSTLPMPDHSTKSSAKLNRKGRPPNSKKLNKNGVIPNFIPPPPSLFGNDNSITINIPPSANGNQVLMQAGMVTASGVLSGSTTANSTTMKRGVNRFGRVSCLQQFFIFVLVGWKFLLTRDLPKQTILKARGRPPANKHIKNNNNPPTLTNPTSLSNQVSTKATYGSQQNIANYTSAPPSTSATQDIRETATSSSPTPTTDSIASTTTTIRNAVVNSSDSTSIIKNSKHRGKKRKIQTTEAGSSQDEADPESPTKRQRTPPATNERVFHITPSDSGVCLSDITKESLIEITESIQHTKESENGQSPISSSSSVSSLQPISFLLNDSREVKFSKGNSKLAENQLGENDAPGTNPNPTNTNSEQFSISAFVDHEQVAHLDSNGIFQVPFVPSFEILAAQQSAEAMYPSTAQHHHIHHHHPCDNIPAYYVDFHSDMPAHSPNVPYSRLILSIDGYQQASNGVSTFNNEPSLPEDSQVREAASSYFSSLEMDPFMPTNFLHMPIPENFRFHPQSVDHHFTHAHAQNYVQNQPFSSAADNHHSDILNAAAAAAAAASASHLNNYPGSIMDGQINHPNLAHTIPYQTYPIPHGVESGNQLNLAAAVAASTSSFPTSQQHVSVSRSGPIKRKWGTGPYSKKNKQKAMDSHNNSSNNASSSSTTSSTDSTITLSPTNSTSESGPQPAPSASNGDASIAQPSTASTTTAKAGKVSSGKHRPNFSAEVVAMLVKWFEANMDNPYPTQEVKEAFAVQTGLTLKQVCIL
jgi:hypothetical protein